MDDAERELGDLRGGGNDGKELLVIGAVAATFAVVIVAVDHATQEARDVGLLETSYMATQVHRWGPHADKLIGLPKAKINETMKELQFAEGVGNPNIVVPCHPDSENPATGWACEQAEVYLEVDKGRVASIEFIDGSTDAKCDGAAAQAAAMGLTYEARLSDFGGSSYQCEFYFPNAKAAWGDRGVPEAGIVLKGGK